MNYFCKKRWLYHFATLLLLVWSATAHTEVPAKAHSLKAEAYSSSRVVKLITPRIKCNPFGSPIEAGVTVSKLQSELISERSKDSEWTPKNPKWERLQALLSKEINTRNGFEAYERLGQLASEMVGTELDETLASAVESLFSDSELKELLDVYGTSSGRMFSEVQPFLFTALSDGISRTRAMLLNRTPLPNITVSESEFQTTLSLFDEYLKMEWASSNPEKTENGRLTAAILVASGVRVNYGEIANTWNHIPLREQREIAQWRNSPLGLKEREAIGNMPSQLIASGICSQEKRAIRKTKILATLREKWRKLLDADGQKN